MRLSKKVMLVQALDALIGGVVQDRPKTGELILGYMIILRGTHTGAAAVNPITNLGQLIMRSSAGASLVSEQNFGFLTERTRRQQGSILWLNPGGAGVAFALSWFHSFDVAGGEHGNIYPVAHGDSIEIVLPAVLAAVVVAGTTWEVHRVSVDRGRACYLVRYHGQALDLAQLRFTLAGKTASVSIQPASVTPPTRISIFDASEERLMFLPWQSALAYSNIFGKYDANEATEVTYEHYSDSPDSIVKCFGNDIMNLELIGGAGFCQMSHCVVEPFGDPFRNLSDAMSQGTFASQLGRVNRVGGNNAVGAVSALIGAATSLSPTPPSAGSAGSSSAPVPPPPGTQFPIPASARIAQAMRRG